MPDLDFDEDDVLTRASSGDRDAFGRLYERYVERISAYRLALRGRPDPLEGGFAEFHACAHAVFDPFLECAR